jgi:hypothetical protein
MREWPVFPIGIVAAALCCLLTPIMLALFGIASLRAIVGELFLPLFIGVAALAALALGLRARARQRRRDGAHDQSHKKA